MNTFYDLEAELSSGKNISFQDFEGKVVLVVNTASKCGLTPQYKELEELYQKYKDDGLVILGFPCNQFANQEPGTDAEISQSCSINYGVTFPIFKKIEVNGENTHPVFQYLKENGNGWFGKKIKWNFTKFLVSQDSKKVRRFAPIVSPKKLEKYIIQLIKS